MQQGEKTALPELEIGDDCPFYHDEPINAENTLDRATTDKHYKNMETGLQTRKWKINRTGDIQPQDEIIAKKKAKEKNKVWGDDKKISLLNPKNYLENRTIGFAAHHVIPVKALERCKSIMRFIEKTDNYSDGDIGYNINGVENGIWLPSYQGAPKRKKTGETITKQNKHTELTPNQNFTFEVMRELKRQYHVGRHPPYNEWVTGRLYAASLTLFTFKSSCKCEKKTHYTPYRLISRLNHFSNRLIGFLSSTPANWKEPIFTSPQARQYKLFEENKETN